MRSEQRTVRRLEQQLAAAEDACDHQANVITALADALYLPAAERDLLTRLRELIGQVAHSDDQA